MRRAHVVFAATVMALTLGCSTAAAPRKPAAPWSAPALEASKVPAIFSAEWRTAVNRDTCALVAPISQGRYPEARPRRALFSGGWAVAYDLPTQKNAFGIAGTGSKASDPSYANWPNAQSWADGSSVGYGPEGGTGTRQLAYLRIAGQECLYNIWSGISEEHLQELLNSLRFVK